MADNLPHTLMEERAEIDTSSPFHSVKAAVNMFHQSVNGWKPRSIEPSMKSSEINHLEANLQAIKDQLTEAEKPETRVHKELRDTRKLLQQITQGNEASAVTKQQQVCVVESTSKMNENTLKLESLADVGNNTSLEKGYDASSSSDVVKQSFAKQNNKASSHSDGNYHERQINPNTEEKHVVWEVELKVAKEQHLNAVAELESAQRDLERLREEFVRSLREKEDGLRQAEEALAAAELNAKRAEELSHEMSGTNESLSLVRLACIEASKDRAALLATKASSYTHFSNKAGHSIAMVEELEMKLALAATELTRLQQELVSAKEAEVKVASAASDAYASLAVTMRELEDMRKKACAASGSCSATCTLELNTSKLELKKALEDRESLQANLHVLQGELHRIRREAANFQDREKTLNETISTLNVELEECRRDLTSAIAAEANASKAVGILTQALQQAEVETNEASSKADTLREEIARARADAEYARSSFDNVKKEMQVAIEATQDAKAAEKKALEQVNILSEKLKKMQFSASEVDISVSLSEYNQLKRKMQETEDLANIRIAAAKVQVEAIRKCEMELEQKVNTLSNELKLVKSSNEQALYRAEMAEQAKQHIVNEMRKWREHGKGHERTTDQANRKYKTGDGDGTVSNQLVVVNSKVHHSRQSSKQAHESLMRVFSNKMTSIAKDSSLLSDQSISQKKKKKKHYVLPTMSVFSSKKDLRLWDP